MAVTYSWLSTPLGALWVARSSRGVVRISLRARSEKAFLEDLRRTAGQGAAEVRKDRRATARVIRQLREYFRGSRRSFDHPVDLEALTPFQRRVLRATARIPFGEVVSYGRIAAAIGKPRASRAVGNALGANPVPILIPCHRVVAGDGTLGGFTGGTAIKRRLLEAEGISI